MQEDLIGYLLGALEPAEMRQVEIWLSESADARRQLAELEAALQGLDRPNTEEFEPPPTDLVARTLASLPPLPPLRDNHSAAMGDDVAPTGDASVRTEPSRSIEPLSQVSENGDGTRWTWRDWVASMTAACIVIAIALPSMLEGRFVARKQACQDNLRELGVAMTQFVNRNAEQRLPSVAPDGYQAFAGMYSPRLREAGLIAGGVEDTLCPSLEHDQFWPTRLTVASNRSLSVESERMAEVVTLSMLDEVGRELLLLSQRGGSSVEFDAQMLRAIEELRWMQTTAGGHYSYTLGVRDGDYFSSPRFQGRSSFAVMSDAVVMRNGYVDDATGKKTPTLSSHGGRGINVLYEDGRVGFMTSESMSQIPDHPLFNHAGQIEAGVTIDDASLAPSWQPPFIRAIQR